MTTPPSLSPLCQLKGGCMGCCGRNFGTKEEIKASIAQNTREFHAANPKTEEEFTPFRDRYDTDDLLKGVCRNLIVEKGCNLCPLHPARHSRDLRIGHCDTNYLCKTARTFATWSEEKQQRFILFLAKRKIDNITYSILMDNDTLLEEFRKKIL